MARLRLLPRDPAGDALAALVERFDPTALDLPRRGARIRVDVIGDAPRDVLLRDEMATLVEPRGEPDAVLRADLRTWMRIGGDLRAGMDAYRDRRLSVRRNLHLGVGFLAATNGSTEAGRLRFRRVGTRKGDFSVLEAGTGDPLVMLHGLGGTKISFLPTVAALTPARRLIAVDMPGFGDSDKPIGSYDPPFFSRRILALLDALELERTDLLGHSLGGRVAIEVGIDSPTRIRNLVLMTPSMAWLRTPPWAPALRLLRPELGLIQPAPKAVVDRVVRRIVPGSDRDGWLAAGVDEFLRAYDSPRGRAAFYAAARNILLEDPDRFWHRLERLSPRTLFVWGRRDPLVPIAFMHHVERRLDAAEHVELECGHVPQLECPHVLHRSIERFLASGGRHSAGGRASRPRAGSG
jgi:pimeloyl-ACP methyl ester carboxylesterase